MIAQSGGDGQKIDKSSVRDETFGSDKGCSLALSDHGQPGRMFLRMRGSKMPPLLCLLPDGGWKYLSSGAWTDDIDEVVVRATTINYW